MFRVIDKAGELVTCAAHIEVACSLLRRIPRAHQVTTDEGVVLALRAPIDVFYVGGGERRVAVGEN